MTLGKRGLLSIFLALLSVSVSAASLTVKMYSVMPGQVAQLIGVIQAKDVRRGLLLTPLLHDLPAGYHGFHLHSRPSCANAGKAAGSHWDPTKTGRHRGPYRPGGHLGDLPVLYVNAAGIAQHAVLAPRLTVSDLLNHTMMIHYHGDNYTDQPVNGGGGARMVCGIVYREKVKQ